MSRRVGIVLQARFGSARLPGKALARIGHRTILERCLTRLKASGVGPVVLATTTNAEDDALADVAHGLNVDVYRGSVDDVLGRYVEAALWRGFDLVVRATGDNPAVDIGAPRRLVETMEREPADYACEAGLPVGAGVEIATTQALVRAASLASDPEDREHVTTYIKRRQDVFAVTTAVAPEWLRAPDLRLTVDTADDLGYLRRVLTPFAAGEPPLAAIIAAASRCRRSVAA